MLPVCRICGCLLIWAAELEMGSCDRRASEFELGVSRVPNWKICGTLLRKNSRDLIYIVDNVRNLWTTRLELSLTRKPVDTNKRHVFKILELFYKCFWLLILCQWILSVYKVNPQQNSSSFRSLKFIQLMISHSCSLNSCLNFII